MSALKGDANAAVGAESNEAGGTLDSVETGETGTAGVSGANADDGAGAYTPGISPNFWRGCVLPDS